jgi:hypothetical protein
VTRKKMPPLSDALRTVKTWGDLERIRIERGYQPGWTQAVARFHKERFGERGQPVAADAFDDFEPTRIAEAMAERRTAQVH